MSILNQIPPTNKVMKTNLTSKGNDRFIDLFDYCYTDGDNKFKSISDSDVMLMFNIGSNDAEKLRKEFLICCESLGLIKLYSGEKATGHYCVQNLYEEKCKEFISNGGFENYFKILKENNEENVRHELLLKEKLELEVNALKYQETIRNLEKQLKITSLIKQYWEVLTIIITISSGFGGFIVWLIKYITN